MFALPGIASFYFVNIYLLVNNVKPEDGGEKFLYESMTINLGIAAGLFVTSYLIVSINDLFPHWDNLNMFFMVVANILSPAMIYHYIGGVIYGLIYFPLRIYILRKKYKQMKEVMRDKDKMV